MKYLVRKEVEKVPFIVYWSHRYNMWVPRPLAQSFSEFEAEKFATEQGGKAIRLLSHTEAKTNFLYKYLDRAAKTCGDKKFAKLLQEMAQSLSVADMSNRDIEELAWMYDPKSDGHLWDTALIEVSFPVRMSLWALLENQRVLNRDAAILRRFISRSVT